MRSSYKKEDVTFLLKDITGLVEPKPAIERERLIQSGCHYCEMLPMEYIPSKAYMEAYQEALIHFAKPVALSVGRLSDQIVEEKGKQVVLVSLARAGTPIGILLKHYIRKKYGFSVPHYSISIIRGRGIDHNAMQYLLNKHRAEELVFVDGWTGKGAILTELQKEIAAYKGVSSRLAVIADPANITDLCGTYQDILIPSSCLNSTISGLVSRTFLRDDLIGKDVFHGAAYYEELSEVDLSYAYLDAIEAEFQMDNGKREPRPREQGIDEVRQIARKYQIADINLIKPGIGETTRVLLRRIPWKILLAKEAKEDASLMHILRLAEEKGVPVETVPLRRYKACGLIQTMADT